jgi:hypothetical protein
MNACILQGFSWRLGDMNVRGSLLSRRAWLATSMLLVTTVALMHLSSFLDLPAEQLTAHQPPALLVERALAIVGAGGRVRLKAHNGLDCLQLTEACAQAMAVIMGLRLRGEGHAQAASGMLVGAKTMRMTRAVKTGDVVEVSATQTAELGPLQLYEVSASVGDEVILTGELKVVRTEGLA